MRKKTLLIYLVFAFKIIFGQNPLLKVYIDAKEVNKNDVAIQAWVKSNSKLYPILTTDKKRIALPEEIEFHTIEAVKFIVRTDTIVFPVSKLLEDLKRTPEKNAVDELYAIFKEIASWELHIDSFKYFDEKGTLADAKAGNKRTSIYNNYKIYGLRTSSFKYYVVKA